MADEIRQLLSGPKDEPWSADSLMLWTKRRKSAQRLQDDARSAYVLKRLNDGYVDKNAPEGSVQQDMAREYARDPSPWESRYEPRSGDYPLYHALQWTMSMPAAIYATGKMVGNEVHKALAEDRTAAKHVPYPEAYKDYEYATNTFTGGLTDYAGALPQGQSYWHDVAGLLDEQQRVGKKFSGVLAPSNVSDDDISSMRYAEMPQMEDGEAYLNRATLPSDKYLGPTAAKYAGPLMDAVFSFPSSLGPVANSVMARKGGQALAELLTDYAPATAHMWIPATSEYITNNDDAVADWHSRPHAGYGWGR